MRQTVARYLWAEYCPGPLFWGWWMYERDRIDGGRNDDGHWGWIEYDWHRRKLVVFLRSIGLSVPVVNGERHQINRLAEWFSKLHPRGLLVEIVPTGPDWSWYFDYRLAPKPNEE